MSQLPLFQVPAREIPVRRTKTVKAPVEVCPPVTTEYADWNAFLIAEGRFPRITDQKKPWEYPGWLLAYRLLCDEHPAVPSVWHYWLATMEAGKLLDLPIPQVHYGPSRGNEGAKAIEKWLRPIENHLGSISAFELLLDWFLWGFGHKGAEPPRLDARTNEELYRAVDLAVLLLHPADYFGEYLAESGRHNHSGFFPTPHEICEMMMLMNKGTEDWRYKTINDPCVGSGRLLLHAGNHSLRLSGMDINSTVLKICFVNGYLYCPWLVKPFPESFFEKGETRAAVVKTRRKHTAPRIPKARRKNDRRAA